MDKTAFPEWANWIAQDEDGTWWAYEVEPLQHHKGWYENEVGRNQKLDTDKKPVDWRLTLKKLDTRGNSDQVP